ncbi:MULTISPECIES: 1-phosphofructokinase [Oceanimonas]|uniref:Phosphofructokinase n=1 Tax=Oceanimonas doudoroffii TaxID=84158 RepID=A0A233RFA4_9GAMM|nr:MULTISPECIES: 1-phosphofructokinase [Oceanimonas]NHI01590.1 Tagatose-6-phosphate kinase [Oceanimonas sp. MB9]OXY82080.1 1-phosphofructokinase [Oceanimonas doudoroffii]
MSMLTLTLNPALDLTVSLEQLKAGHVNIAKSGHLGAAGKGINVARALADLGHKPRASGFLGLNNDASFRALFGRHGIGDDFVRLPGDTRVNVKISEAEGRVTDINLPGLRVGEGDWTRLLARLESLADDFEYLVVAGSLPPGVSPAQLEGMIEMWRERGKTVWLDASGEALRAGIRGRPALIKPNLEELEGLVGQPVDSDEALIGCALTLRQRGIEQVVVSAGADGVCWFGPNGAWRARVPRVKVVSTVGAGDSLVAGLCAGMVEGLNEPDNLRRAVALSLMAVTQIGVGIYDQKAFAAFQRNIEIEPIARQGADT